MKIAIFHNLPGGGAKRMVYSLVKELSKSNIIDEFTISTSTNYLDTSRYINRKKNYYYEQGKGPFRFVLNGLTSLNAVHKKIAEDINREKYDIVFVNHDFITKSPYLLRYLKVRSLYFCHEPPREYYEAQNLHSPRLKDKFANLLRLPFKYVDRTNFLHSDVVVANSDYSKSIIQRIYKKTPRVIHPGVDIQIFKPHFIKKKNQIISVGSLLSYKGHTEVIKSLGTINRKKRPKLIIVGNGRKSDEDEIMKNATKQEVEIKVVNNISDRDLSKLYASSKAVVSLAYGEPFGLSVLEGMACGIPAIVVNEGGLIEQVKDGENGYITSRNYKEAGNKIVSAMTHNQSLGKKARMIVAKEWTWQKTIGEINELLNLIVYGKV